ncbi:alanine racemase [Actinobaculum suis]|uniref:alanine racemase n=1 Tax=Actinobaculum suis TaxID=1657 RepID=UPI00080871BA|nr:alanine racemase [Actinobaculum suis]OCA95310.1 alanine racemase [Actinobaculum suis]
MKLVIESFYPSRAEISLGALAHNFRWLRARLPKTKIMAIVKADAYGHGIVPCARALAAAGADYLGVAQLGEAMSLAAQLRDDKEATPAGPAGPAGANSAGGAGALPATHPPIFSWIYAPGSDLRAAFRTGIEISVGTPWVVDELERYAGGGMRGAKIHIAVDTGMAREGFTRGELERILPRLQALASVGAVEIKGLWSHLAQADTLSTSALAPSGEAAGTESGADQQTYTHVVNPAPTQAQISRFEEAKQMLAEVGITPPLLHLAASGGALFHNKAQYSMVRPGILLYGISPNPQVATAAELGLQAVMTLRSRIIGARITESTTGVSYGGTQTVPAGTHLGIVPLGYGDGIPRAASNRGQVLVRGHRCPIIGRVCMDQFVIQLPPSARPGDEVIIFGDESTGAPTTDNWGEWSDSIGYEIPTRIGPRVPRVYVE